LVQRRASAAVSGCRVRFGSPGLPVNLLNPFQASAGVAALQRPPSIPPKQARASVCSLERPPMRLSPRVARANRVRVSVKRQFRLMLRMANPLPRRIAVSVSAARFQVVNLRPCRGIARIKCNRQPIPCAKPRKLRRGKPIKKHRPTACPHSPAGCGFRISKA